jgi:hypothetical protein
VGRVRLIAALATAASLLAAGLAAADRKPTDKERRQIAKLLGLPEPCAHIRVSTVPDQPRYAIGAYRFKSPDKCDKYAADGVVIFKRAEGRWRFVDAGSSFFCSDLYQRVPQSVVEDLDIFCD